MWLNAQIQGNMLESLGKLNDEIDKIKGKLNLKKSKKTKFSD